jgi:hypothetical protein
VFLQVGRNEQRADFAPRFEGRETLESLLSVAGCPLDAEAVLARFRKAVEDGRQRSDVIPELFAVEPHFPDPALARKLYENLFALWGMVEEGKAINLTVPAPAPPTPPRPARPEPFGEAPDEAWVEAAWRHVEGLDERSLERLEHAFENRQDALWVYLDEVDLSDNALPHVRTLLFELWAMLEVGWPPGLSSVSARSISSADPGGVPQALRAYAQEALFEAEQDEVAPLSGEELERARRAAEAGLAALWSARRPLKEKT